MLYLEKNASNTENKVIYEFFHTYIDFQIIIVYNEDR